VSVLSRIFRPLTRLPHHALLRAFRPGNKIVSTVLILLYLSHCLDSKAVSPVLLEADRLSWLGNWNAAGPLYEKAEWFFKAEGDSHKEIHARIGRIRAQGNSHRWEDVSQSLADQLKDPIVQSDKKLHLWCLVSKGYVDLDLDIAASKRSWKEALQIADVLGERQWASRARGELGIIAFLEGDTGAAVSLVGRALLFALASGDSAEQVRLLSMLGNGYNEVHRFKESLWFFQHAISIAEGTPGAGFPFMAYAGRATALSGVGRSADARQLLNKALATARAERRRDEESQALVLLGRVDMKTGATEEAKTYFKDAARIAAEAGFYRNLAQAMSDAAALYRNEGDLKSAGAALTVSLQASRRLGDTYYLPRNLTGLAEVRAAQKKVSEADKLFGAAEDVMDGILINAHSPIAIRAMVDLTRETYLQHFKLVKQEGNVARAVSLIERVRSRDAEAGIYLRDKNDRPSGSGALLESEITKLQLTLLRTENQNARSSLLDKLSQLERNLAYERNEIDHSQLLTTSASLEQIQTALRNDEEFMEYVLDEPHAFCIVLTKQLARIVALPAGENHITQLLKEYEDEIKAPRLAGAHELYRILLQPILRFQKSRLIIASDGPLGQLPFEALRDRKGNYLIQSHVVTYVPSGSTIWSQRNAEGRPRAQRAVLALGDVDYTRAVAVSKLRKVPLPSMILRGLEKVLASQMVDLPESREEVLSIIKAVGGRSTVLLGREATETAFKSQPLSEFSVIHLAVHAMPDAQYPERSSLILGVDPSATDDGLLQVREIMHLHLNADLVTLSACETGTTGDAGVVSLGEAFLIGGAKAVVVSLWNVEDHSTTMLMEYFYTHLAQGDDKATALARAKRDFIAQNENNSPFHWAGFVMVGEGSSALSFGPR
jgi:CHAT domain-containing protein